MATKKEMTTLHVVSNRPIGPAYVELTLQHPTCLPVIEAGQFAQVLVPDTPQVMLRRPISIHDVDPAQRTLKLLIQKVGAGTQQLSRMQPGQELNLLLPLGRGFALQGRNVLLVGGGAGIAPLLLLARTLHSQGVTLTILLGGRTQELIPSREAFTPLGTTAYATDDGSLGHHGLVTQHPLFAAPYDHIYTCGPTPMMKAVARDAQARHIPCQVSLENLMACGLGACLCCVVDSDQGHLCVCQEGPVFPTEKLQKWMTT